MGVVYEAEEERLNRRVALKILPDSAIRDASQIRRFEREAVAAAGCIIRTLSPFFGVGQQDGYPYYVMQYIEGSGLDVASASCGGCVREADRFRTPKGHTRMPARRTGRSTKPEPGNGEHSPIDAADIAWSLVTGTTPRGNYPGTSNVRHR